MIEQDLFKRMLPLELKPTEIRIWRGRSKIPMDFDGYDRLRINPETIEFDLGRKTYVASLKEEPLWIDYQIVYSSIETCPN